jgi:hypothetical protein
MNDRELMQQALMALEEGMTSKEWRELVKALRERLAQPEQNPLTEKRIEELYSFWIVDCQDIVGFARAIERSKPQMQPCAGRNCGSTNPNLHSAECFEDYEKSTGMAQPEQEPVAWMHKETWLLRREISRPKGADWDANYWEPLYTAPRQWQGLTDEEIKEIIGPWGETPIKGYTRKLFDQIEAKLKEKNR